ncbi:MAG: DUF3267 domain-containing protein [Bacilli bacterium]|nr:DUF3267 domain-containing protein [Bacilli bacterium]
MPKRRYYLFELDMNPLNVISILLFILMIAITLGFYKLGIIKNWDYPVGLLFILMIPYLILHELLHSLSYVLHGADFKNITYGAHIEKGVLCCLCKQNITKKNILFSLIYPFVWIGVLTYIIGIIMDWPILIALSIVNLSGCAGDLIMFFAFLRLEDFEYCEYDNPTAFGLYSAKDLSNKKMFGIKYVGEERKLPIEDLRKVTVSKTSIISFILILVLGILWMFL